MAIPEQHIKELFGRIAAGEEDAFRDLFNLYRSRLYYFARHIVATDAEAEEVVQDVFARLWTSRFSLGQIASPDAYIFVMAKNRSLDYIKQVAGEQRMRKTLASAQQEAENTTEEDFDLGESRRLIETAINTLTPQQARIFRLSKEQGLKRQEIAAQLGISENTVKNHLAEAIRLIKKYLADHGDTILLFFIWYCI